MPKLLFNDGMDRKDTICISRNQAFVIGFGLLLILLTLFANYVSSRQLNTNSRAAGEDLRPAVSFDGRVKEVSRACRNLAGYLAWTGKNGAGGVVFDRFTGRYYSLDQVNPVVTPQPGQPLSGYCAVSGKPGGNWCSRITTETACTADCGWISGCSVCAPKGADVNLICPR